MKDWAADGDVGTREYYKDKCEELYKRVTELEEKYESTGTKCHGGHVNNLPLALWDCPMCTEELKAKVERWKSKYVDQKEGNVGLVQLEREAREDRATWETAYHKLEAALRDITELDPGLWDTMQKIARKALGMEP